ncbi:CLUMA_CG002756, isoform A [Clunio marinus]|uniref:CLUMA_CG002756, isoform A n=1 Tax=Clunio marinus TaxID=568069 RepID=A0A1J1HKY0_9DIPT|nr:CLUMA_CG002756, isoform A [Clunio marinus]
MFMLLYTSSLSKVMHLDCLILGTFLWFNHKSTIISLNSGSRVSILRCLISFTAALTLQVSYTLVGLSIV